MAFDRTYSPYYAVTPPPAGASMEAAVTAAAYTVLSSVFGSSLELAKIQARYDNHLAQVTDGQAETDGIAFGQSVGQAIIALRSADGMAAALTTPHPDGEIPGQWRRTASGEPVAPGWGSVTPWVMTSGNQFDQGGPPALGSPEYLANYNETMTLGAADSMLRTADQTAAVMFWADHVPAKWYTVARDISAQEGLTLVENARLFELLSLTMADATIAGWDMKYNYNFWRPETAIHEGDNDLNAVTVGDPAWQSLIAAPAFPGYVSGHSITSAAAAEMLELYFGRGNYTFQIPGMMGMGQARTFTSFQQAAEEAGMSRVWGGIHFQFENQDGLVAGGQLAQYVYANAAVSVPAAPTNLTAKLQTKAGTAPRIALTFRDNARNETGFQLERAVNGGAFATLATLPARNNTGNVNYTDLTAAAGNTYAYRVAAMNGVMALSAYSNTVTVVVAAAPVAPLNFTGTAVATSGTRARVTLSWTDNSNNETQFVIRRATNAAFTGASTFTISRSKSQSSSVGSTVTLTQNNLPRGTTYYYQILARNAFGDSVWVNLSTFPITTP